MKQNKILITGGTGFIGYHLSKRCIKLGWSVTSLSSNFPKPNKIIRGVKYIIVDITNKKKLSKIKNDFDYIVNLAGYVDHSNKKKTLDSHYIGCKNLASLFLNKKIKKFVQVGSSIEYGKLRSPQIENKKNSQSTFSIYGKAKLLSTKYLMAIYKKEKFPTTVIRLYLVYGPKQDINRVIPITIKNALLDKKFNCSSGLQYRDFIYIDDVINAILKTLKNRKTNGEIINIGSNKPVRIKDLIIRICYLVGSGKPIFGKIKLRKDEIKSLYPNINKAHKILKWRPKISLNTGLKRTIKYYKNAKFN
ncbi:NAD-dependent epimerase/dehydratase family protein [Candidatus Pelagibacter sp.]|uniref:NAD-dependent epimerase/dehydratase family protein n=1 Tax=Candidatus Pelagibacter sp. TaxID=2024849 RepID=UPI003F876C3B